MIVTTPVVCVLICINRRASLKHDAHHSGGSHVQAYPRSNRRLRAVFRHCQQSGRVCARSRRAHHFFYAKPEYPVSFYGEGALIDPTTPEKFSELAEEQAQTLLSAAESQAKAREVPSSRLTVTSDVPYEAIIAAAMQAGCDLIFMASHGRRGISGLLLGSETQKVLTHSTIPVLVYR